MTQLLPEVKLPAQFRVRLDPYWQSVAVYAVTLILYVLIKAMWETTLQTGLVQVVLTDPIVVLLGLFVVISLVSLVTNMFTHRAIIVGEEAIAFVSRFHERTFALDEIERIAIGRDRRIRVRGVLSLVKITIRGRRRPLRIRPAVYENEHILVSALLSLRKQKDLPRT
jgi:hypothetical protein